MLCWDLPRQPVILGTQRTSTFFPPGWLQDLVDSLTPLSLSFLHCEMGTVMMLPGVAMMTAGCCLQRALSQEPRLK